MAKKDDVPAPLPSQGGAYEQTGGMLVVIEPPTADPDTVLPDPVPEVVLPDPVAPEPEAAPAVDPADEDSIASDPAEEAGEPTV